MKQKITFALIMGLITTAVVSFVSITINLGFSEKFLAVWLRSWAIAYVLTVSTMLVVAPRVQWLVEGLLKRQSTAGKDN